ncbi:MAG: chromosomal replication initiator protein DnaA, partial [Oscillospiraceae bacterium]
MGFEVNVILESLEENEAGVAPLILTNEEREEENKILSQNGEYSYTFDNFIVGSSNKFAHAASLAVAEAPAAAYNPLFIHGGSGLGKTHLLCAICNEIEKNNPSSNILYVKSEGFTNELIDSLSKNKMAEFRDKYRPVDVLLMDDIQFIGGKDSTQEEFFHTFNTLYEAGKQIVVTSDRPPKEIKTLEDRLRTRFESGLIADIQPPDYETRVAIIKRKAELLDLELSPDVIDYIATKLKTNIRQLEGTVKKIKPNKLLAGMTPTIVSAQIAIRDILNDSQPISVVIERIIAEVARYYEVSPSDVKSNKRAAQISLARQASMYIIREITGISMAAIGDEFGGRDHSTVVYALKQVDSMLSTNPHFKNTVEDIIKNIKNEN